MENSIQIAGHGITEVVTSITILYLIYHLLRKTPQWQNVFLLGLSLFTYNYWSSEYLLLLIAIIALTYFLGLILEAHPDQKKLFLSLGIGFNILLLVLFKYPSVLTVSILNLAKHSLSFFDILPLGLGFFTLQSISYLVEVSKGKFKAERNLINLALYLSFIFKLPAGPIERPQNFLQQLNNSRTVSGIQVNEGIFLITFGFLEKFVMADNLAKIINPIFDNPEKYIGINIFLAFSLFGLQLYGDFAGYSHIARGLAKLLGFDLSINFKLPYFVRNPNEFWQRWHISLSNWLRDYVFFPTRRLILKNKLPQFISILIPPLITMTISGFWHGSGGMFIVWGIYHAMLLIGYQYLYKKREYKNAMVAFTISGFEIVLMFTLITIGWAFFRSENLPHFLSLVENLSFQSDHQTYLILIDTVFFAGPVILFNLIQAHTGDLTFMTKYHPLVQAVAYAFILTWVMIFSITGYTEFIYAQF